MRQRKRFAPKPTLRPVEQRPSVERMGELLAGSGIRLKPHQLELLWKYHNLLRKRNEDRDLTRIINFEAMVVKHYIDCMIVGNFTELPSPMVDVGTGAGFPGIPLKIRYPELELTLAEPRPNRVAFLREVVTTLRLTRIHVFDHKVVSRSFRQPMRAVITRAVETMDKTILRTSACLGEGGRLIFLKGPGVDPELSEIDRRFQGKFRLLLNKKYFLPHTQHERRLVVFEKLIPAEIPDGT